MAISTMKVGATVREGFKTEVQCSHNFIIDQPKMMGGQDLGPNPLEVFLSTLPACICAIGRIIANQRRIKLHSIDVQLEGDIDKDFLLGLTEEGRAGFIEIRSIVDIDAELTDDEKQVFLDDIAKRCPIADNMAFTSVLKNKLN